MCCIIQRDNLLLGEFFAWIPQFSNGSLTCWLILGMLNLFLQEKKVHCELLLPKPVAYLRCKTWLMNPNTRKQKKSAFLISCIDNSTINCVSRFMGYGFLDAPRHLCKKVCLSVRPSVSHAISSRCVQGATFAVYPAWSITWASILLSHIPQKSISPINIIGGALDSLQWRFRSIKKKKKILVSDKI